ncbi:MAG: hypothetical protein D3906_07415, partial [Candidatus Electrothrix sp. AUS1_2]|nr:hypothetical protein [Candidatus Electrothrix sp. AUS1_2]
FLYPLSFALIGGGAVCNIIDRVLYGSVVDFLDFYIGKYHWPAFNAADSAIFVGVTIFFLLQIFEKEEGEKKDGTRLSGLDIALHGHRMSEKIFRRSRRDL